MNAKEAFEQTEKNLQAYENGDLLGGNPYSPIEKYRLEEEKTELMYKPIKASDKLPPVPGYYSVRDVTNPSQTFRKLEYEGERISGSSWRLNYVWLKPIQQPVRGVSEEYLTDVIGVIIDQTRFHDVRLEHILSQKESLTKELTKAIVALYNDKTEK